MLSSRIAVACTVPLVLFLSTGCAEARTESLADAKSIVQLGRIEAGTRLPEDQVASVELIEDTSVACKSEQDDPTGIERRWTSTSVVALTPTAADSLNTTFKDLIDSFVGNGWSEVSYGGAGAVSLQKPDAAATLSFKASKSDPDADGGPSIRVTIESGCVVTDGAESEEVETLEKLTAS